MKAFVDPLRPHDANVTGKIAVRTEQPASFISHAGRVKMNNLPGRMHAGVRPACADHLHGRIRHQRQRIFQSLLYAETGFLALPAVVSGPVVLNAECDTNF